MNNTNVLLLNSIISVHINLNFIAEKWKLKKMEKKGTYDKE